MSTRYLPSIEALTAADDRRLHAELEIRDVLEKLARVRALVERADLLLESALAGGDQDGDLDPATALKRGRLALAILASIRKI